MNADDLAKILDELGQRLGPTGEHVFALAVRQVYIDATIGIVFGGLVLVTYIAAVVIGGRVAYLAYRKAAADRDHMKPDPWDYAFPPAILSVIGGALAFFAVSTILDGISKILNPEYAALRDILGAIR